MSNELDGTDSRGAGGETSACATGILILSCAGERVKHQAVAESKSVIFWLFPYTLLRPLTSHDIKWFLFLT